MIFTTQTILSLVFVAICSLLICFGRKNGRKQLPGPYPLPVIGNLHLLGDLPYRTLGALAKKYGPIMRVHFGSVPMIVVSSSRGAELFLKTHDKIFASRPKGQAADYMSYGMKGVALTAFGPYWRNVRKMCTVELLTPAKISFYEQTRKEEVGLMVDSIKTSALASENVDICTKIAEVIEDMTCRMVFGIAKDDRFDLKGVIQQTSKLVGTFNVSDFVPWLAPFDLQGLQRGMKANSEEVDAILEMIIDEHEQGLGTKSESKDFVNTLLSLMNDPTNAEGYTVDRTNVKAIMLDIVVGTMDATTSTIQWTMLELLNSPRVMTKVKKELESVVGLGRMVEEADLSNLVYLSMVFKESMRLHPVAPLLFPHESMEDVTIDGYYLPKGSRFMVNVWAIGHDPSIWSDNVEEFYPERFETNDVDYRGREFQLLPFGAGRRGCPGLQLGLTMVRIILAQLVHCFEWKVDGDLDMTEKHSLAVHPAKHYHAIPTYRLIG